MFFDNYKNKMITESDKNENSKLGTYYRINPSFEKFVPNPQTIMELERELVTRFRTGSHSLAIELARYSNVLSENRLCVCEQAVQTIWHIFMECPLTNCIVQRNYRSLRNIFDDENVHKLLLTITRRLKIRI